MVVLDFLVQVALLGLFFFIRVFVILILVVIVTHGEDSAIKHFILR